MAWATSHAVPWRPAGRALLAGSGQPLLASRPSEVSMVPGTTRLTRIEARCCMLGEPHAEAVGVPPWMSGRPTIWFGRHQRGERRR